jgi:hypothetical protein
LLPAFRGYPQTRLHEKAIASHLLNAPVRETFPRTKRITYSLAAGMCLIYLPWSPPVRSLIELPVEIATAFFFAAAIGVGAGAIAATHTQRLAPAIQVALAAFAVALASFGYAIWRGRRLRSRRMFRRVRSVAVAARR